VKAQKLVHPGGVIDPSIISQFKYLKNDNPQVVHLLKITPLDYKCKAIPIVDIGPYGSGQGHKEFTEDGEMAYKAAVAYLVTKNEAYARLSQSILTKWATMCTVFQGTNAPLEAAWGTAAMVKAGELLKHLWAGWDKASEARYVKWLDDIILPWLTKPLGWDNRNNWGLSMCEARLMISIFRDGAVTSKYNYANEFTWAQTEYQRISAGYVSATGQTGEYTRDFYHNCFSIGSLIQIPEILWHQGIDLYSHRNSLMHTSLEFNALPLLGKKPLNAVGETKDIWYLPCGWHIGYKHYHGRKGLPMPNTAEVIKKNPCDVFTFHWGLGSLTHAV